MPLDRARVIGGCSSHNGCLAIWGHRADYDDWARLGNDGWGTDEVLPLLREANRRLRVRYPARSEYGPFLEATLDAAPAAGMPVVDDLNDLDMTHGMAFAPMNVIDGVRLDDSE